MIMHLRRSGEANRFPRYPFDPHTKRELLTLDPLGLPFAREVLRRFQLPRIRAPVISGERLIPNGCRSGFNSSNTSSLRLPKTSAKTCLVW